MSGRRFESAQLHQDMDILRQTPATHGKRLAARINSVCEARLFPVVFVPTAVVFLLLFSYTTSPLYALDGADSAVFKTMGQAVLKGKVLYRDIFDNKGPLLYLINAVGQWAIPGRMGLFVLQSVCFSVTLWFVFRTARLFSNGLWSTASVLLALFVLTVFFVEGNQCEQWATYAFAPALWLTMRRHCAKAQNDGSGCQEGGG